MNNKENRNPALDFIRTIAIVSVVAVHHFAFTDFYIGTVSGISMLLRCILRNSFMICVPLFMMLTGYLNNNKEINRKYYFKLIRIIYVYIIASIVCGCFRIFYLKENISIAGFIAGIFSFEMAPYSWYIEMYIGLFLLIPFLNILYDGIKTQRVKNYLIITLLVLTVMPSALNVYNLSGIDWWMMPRKSLEYLYVIPDWWTGIYPITYFFIGKYLREYSIKMSTKKLFLFMIIVVILAGSYNYYRSYGGAFLWGRWQDYGSFWITIQSVLVFSILIKVKYEKVSPLIKKICEIMADCSLGAYLISYIFDNIVRVNLSDFIDVNQQRILGFFVMCTLVLVSSTICSYLINWSYSYGVQKYRHIRKKNKKQKSM